MEEGMRRRANKSYDMRGAEGEKIKRKRKGRKGMWVCNGEISNLNLVASSSFYYWKGDGGGVAARPKK
jgi:hypothetical protein